MMLRTPTNGSEIQKEQPQHAGLFHMCFRKGHSNIGSQKPYWLVDVGGFSPSEKYEFASWDDYSIPNMMGKP